MEYHEIGERFEYHGVVLGVAKGRDDISDCNKCYFCHSVCFAPDNKYCDKRKRLDGTPVYYRLVEQCKPKDMEQENNESKKNDRLDDKLRWELLPLEDMEDVVKVYTAGAKKYGPNTWQNLPDGYNRYKAAFFRHLLEHEKGNWLDEETGTIHLAQ